MLWSRHREFRQTINAYADILLSADVVTHDTVANCHAAKLVVETDGEKRIRSIQTLVHIKHAVVVAPLIRELAGVSASWPAKGGTAAATVEQRALILLQALRDVMANVDQTGVSAQD
jgi:hypothetical protein